MKYLRTFILFLLLVPHHVYCNDCNDTYSYTKRIAMLFSMNARGAFNEYYSLSYNKIPPDNIVRYHLEGGLILNDIHININAETEINLSSDPHSLIISTKTKSIVISSNGFAITKDNESPIKLTNDIWTPVELQLIVVQCAWYASGKTSLPNISHFSLSNMNKGMIKSMAQTILYDKGLIRIVKKIKKHSPVSVLAICKKWNGSFDSFCLYSNGTITSKGNN